MKFYIKKSLNELKKNFTREYANMTSTKDTLDILEFYRNNNNQLKEQVKNLHEILNGIARFYKIYIRINKINQACLRQISLLTSIKILQWKIPVRSPMT